MSKHCSSTSLEHALRGLGYVVQRNKPYAGGFITEHYGAPLSGTCTRFKSKSTALSIWTRDKSSPRSIGSTAIAADLTHIVVSMLAAGDSETAYGFRSQGGGGIGVASEARRRSKIKKAAHDDHERLKSREETPKEGISDNAPLPHRNKMDVQCTKRQAPHFPRSVSHVIF